MLFCNWKKFGYSSDFHDDPDVDPGSALLPFDSFTGSNSSFLYMHEYAFQFSEIMLKTVGELIE